MKKILTLLLAVSAFAACSTDDQYSLEDFYHCYGRPADSGTPTPAPAKDTLDVAIVYNAAGVTLSGDVDSVAIQKDATHLTVRSTTNRYLRLTLSGTTADGSLLVESQKKYGMVLNGVSITNAHGPAINNQCAKSLHLTLADGTTNTLSDGGPYLDRPFDQKGTLFSEGQVYVRGNGTLTVHGRAKNGIACDDYLVLEGGDIHVDVGASGSNGIKVNDGFTMNGGMLEISVKADGARGIKSDARTTFNGGATSITTSGDCLIETIAGVTDTTSAAGVKSDSLFTMTAGTLTITSNGDGGKGINCSRNVEVSGGSLTIVTTGSNDVAKPKGVKSDTGIIVSGGTFSVKVGKSWACDNGTESDLPADHLTVIGTPVTKSVAKKSVTVVFE